MHVHENISWKIILLSHSNFEIKIEKLIKLNILKVSIDGNFKFYIYLN